MFKSEVKLGIKIFNYMTIEEDKYTGIIRKIKGFTHFLQNSCFLQRLGKFTPKKPIYVE